MLCALLWRKILQVYAVIFNFFLLAIDGFGQSE